LERPAAFFAIPAVLPTCAPEIGQAVAHSLAILVIPVGTFAQ